MRFAPLAVACVTISLIPACSGGFGGPSIGNNKLGGPAISENGKYLYARCANGKSLDVSVWEFETGQHYASFGRGTPLDTYGISPDGKRAASIGVGRGMLDVWDLPSSDRAATLELSGSGDERIFAPFMTFTPDGNALLTVFRKKLFWIDLRTWKVSEPLSGLNTGGMAYCASKMQLIELARIPGENGNEIRVYDASKLPDVKPALLRSFRVTTVQDSSRPVLDVSDDGSTIALGCQPDLAKRELIVEIYDLNTGAKRGSIPFMKDKYAQFIDVRIAPDGSRVVASGSYVEIGTAHIGRIIVASSNGKDLVEIPREPGDHPQLTRFTPDGRKIAYSLPKGIVIRDLNTGEERKP
jgi:WD40 repeat protein